jgi:hypothetical protein
VSSISQAQLDEMILSYVRNDWRKTAFIIVRVSHECDDKKLSITDDMIFERIVSLRDSGTPESQGNLSKWLHSEIRLSARGDGATGSADRPSSVD